MSIKKTVAPAGGESAVVNKNNVEITRANTKKSRRFNRCFSFVEVSMEPVSSLSELDSNKFKAEIKRWAKAVVAYARQVSGRLGSSRKSDRYGSSRTPSSSHNHS
ncbi:hypothetical protein CCACVL1_18607 [Corchorus capsularis]|uniref:Uncharacterized protein n=1 Tax=Corchorus capsularis TaxID=210143 RepID=A0A1R3HKU5_COCAP|nr:hypothetical protein CCACVL1_18607 [Corchorus capsularis]